MQPSTVPYGSLAVALSIGLLLLVAGAGSAASTPAETSLITTNETVRVHGVDDAAIGGQTTLSPGSELTVRIRSTAETNPQFFISDTTTVEADGSFVVQFDLSDYDPGDTFTVAVIYNDSRVATADGRVVPRDVDVSSTPDTGTRASSPDGDGSPDADASQSPDGSPTTGTTATPTTSETTIPGFGLPTALVAVGAGVAALRRTRS